MNGVLERGRRERVQNWHGTGNPESTFGPGDLGKPTAKQKSDAAECVGILKQLSEEM